ncbi:MAG: hypothetical protein QHH17_07505 [Candidatus Bathyarchaeota archaeon]|nr:hypothetical protein [Candidatus Bathyarchaeota archaeon]
MKAHNKGQIRIVEAFLCVLIIFSAFTISANLTITQNGTKNDDLRTVGLQALIMLDSDGSLGKYIEEGNWTSLREALSLLLPAGVCFNLTVYDDQMQRLNTDVISNGSFGSQQIAFVEYVCASQNAVFRCYIIHLLLAVVA